MKSRREKVEALLDSPNEGERSAAAAALGRLGFSSDPSCSPARGTPEWFAARRDFHAKIDFCLARMGNPRLSQREIRTIRMQARHRGSPWDRGAEFLPPIYEKLLSAERRMLSSDTQ